jgi:hypothetical protein
MQHEAIEASIVAIHTQRRIEREQLQLELSLVADQIRRPDRPAPDTSSQDDKADIHNSPLQETSAEAVLFNVLDSVDPALTTKLSGCDDASKDRTGGDDALREAHILKHLTGSGRAAHLGWALAKRTLGFERALALCTIAEEDPKRKASTDRYFSWLLRMVMTNDGQIIVAQAAQRVAAKASKAATNQPAAPKEITAAPGEHPDMAGFRSAIAAEIGARTFEAWFSKIRMSREGDRLILTTPHAFCARYVEDNFGSEIVYTVQSHARTQALKVEYRVA